MKYNMKNFPMRILAVLGILFTTTLTQAQSDSPAELMKAYVQQRFDEALPSHKKNLRRSAAEYLTGNDLNAFNCLKELVGQVAKGDLSNTVFSIPLSDITPDAGPWTAEDLGVDALVVDGSLNPAALDAISDKVRFDFHKVIDALLADCPYELYWYNKTKGCTYKAFDKYSYNGSQISVVGNTTFTMYVAQEYAVQEGDKYYPTRFNTEKVASVNVAIAKAKAIVENTTGTTLSRLRAYKDIICEMTSYNYTAAGNSSYPYGDPWQLVWVFDDVPSTKVVCEGYSKAFKYLCDLSGFKDAECLIATGMMDGGTGAGGHMWNIMKMDDGKSYMVDVTNCDAGSIGAPDLLFMAYNPSGSYDQEYTFTVKNSSIGYTYDDDTKAAFQERELTISDTKYYTDMTGDANGDEVVSIGDIVSIVNIIANNPGEYNLRGADANKDGEVSVGDIVTIVNIIAGNE